MANKDNANGFMPYSHAKGGGGQATAMSYPLLSTNAAIGIGSPVFKTTSGVDHATAGTGNPLIGIAAEPKAANTGGTIKVWDDPFQLFVAQCDDGTGTATIAGALGLNINFINSGVQSANSKISKSELDESSATTGATLQFKIIALSTEYQGNALNALGEFNRLVVKINNHQLGSSTGTAGA